MTEQRLNEQAAVLNEGQHRVHFHRGYLNQTIKELNLLGIHKHAIRLQQPESSSRRRGLSSFAEYLTTALEKPTPLVINTQRRLIHRVSPGGSSSCGVNFPDVWISPFLRIWNSDT